MNILVIEAHYDDAAFGCFGTLGLSGNDSVYIYTVCRGRKDDLNDNRMSIAQNLNKNNNFEYNSSPMFYDTELLDKDISTIVDRITKVIKEFEPNLILVPSSDLHPDHKLVNQAVKIAARPTKENSFLTAVWEFPILSSSEWDFGSNKVNGGLKAVNITSTLNDKMDAIAAFNSELKNDLRSSDAVFTYHEFQGYKFGHNYSEVFNIVYERD